MIEAMIAVVATIGDLTMKHPALAKALAAKVVDLLQDKQTHGHDDLEAMRGLVAGLAAAQSQAVQSALSREAHLGGT